MLLYINYWRRQLPELKLKAMSREKGSIGQSLMTHLRTDALYEVLQEPGIESNANVQGTKKAGLDVTVFDCRCPKSVLQFLSLGVYFKKLFVSVSELTD